MPDTITVHHDGETYTFAYINHCWVAKPEWFDLVLQWPDESSGFPVVRKGSLRTPPNGMSGIEALRVFTAIRHKAISALIRQRTGEWPLPEKYMQITES